MKFYQVTLLGCATVAVAQHHNHAHKHPARHGSPLEARAVVTVPGPIQTIYELNGHDISFEDVEAGLKSGKYVLIGDDISDIIPSTTAAPPASSTPTPTPTPTPSSSSAVVEAAEFYQKPSSTSEVESSTSETPTPTPTPAPTESSTSTPAPTYSAAPAPASSSVSSSSSSSGSSSVAANIDADFPSGTIECSDFDSVASYGAVSLDWLGLGGWSGVQITPNFAGNLLLDTAISYIETAISGSAGCVANSFCSYACPPGYQKLQWPASQGNTGQSIGGLYCNSNGYLEISRTEVSTICGSGAGGVHVKNSLSQNVAFCRTDYPGTEGETIPLDTTPGGTFPLTNPNSADYYTWEGSSTTAQYYINPQGASVADACCWGSEGTNMGNWAPVNAGVGQGADGMSYISLFPNAPTNPDGTLDYNIKITGDVSGDCEYKKGEYYMDNVKSATGCTVSVKSGGTATFELS